MRNYAKKIEKVNKKREAILPKKEKILPERIKAPIEKAKEYASNYIPKPKVKQSVDNSKPKRKWGESLGLEEGDAMNHLLPEET